MIKNLKLELDDNYLKISFLGNTKTLLVDHVYEKLNLLAASLERELVIELL